MTTNEDFIRAWMASKSIPEVETKTGMTKVNISAKATYLRKRGVLLPKFTRSGTQLDAGALNKIVAEFLD